MSELRVNVCGVMPLSFYQMLAACLVRTADGTTGINARVITTQGCNCEQVIGCNDSHLGAESQVLNYAFDLDACGLPRLTLITCE